MTKVNILEEQLNFEKEQVHVLTSLYGAVISKETDTDIRICKALELLKSATLIIDDFLDKSELRNGIPSVFAIEGSEKAVLKGEILKSVASLELLKAVKEDKRNYDKLKIIEIFEDTYTVICRGQLKDIQLEQIPFKKYEADIEDYIDLITKTSAIYIRAPLLMAGIVSNQPREELKSLAEFGLNIGIAYQIRDDILDIIGDPENIGKPYAGDIREKKKRLPIIHHLLKTKDNVVREIMDKKKLTDKDIEIVVGKLKETKSIEFCEKELKRYKKYAVKNLYLKNKKLLSIAKLITDL